MMAEQTPEGLGLLAVQLRAQDVSKLIKLLTAQEVLAAGRGFRDMAKQIRQCIAKEKRNLDALLALLPEPIAAVIRG